MFEKFMNGYYSAFVNNNVNLHLTNNYAENFNSLFSKYFTTRPKAKEYSIKLS